MTRRTCLFAEALDDRLTPSFGWAGQYSEAEFYQMTGPDVTSGMYVRADFNEDGWNDLVALEAQDMGTWWFVNLYMSREDGTLGEPQTFDTGSPYRVAAGDFNLPGWPADGRPDLAIFDSYYASGTNTDVVIVYRNLGPGIFVNEYTYVTEGNTGTDATFGVWLEYATDVDVTVHYETADDRPDATATTGSDYISTSGDVIIPAGQTSATFTVPVIGDRLPEPTESFLVWVDGWLAYGVILDDEVVPQISVGDAMVTEGNAGAASATFTVTLSGPYSEPITFAYATADGSAAAGSDYQASSGTLSFAPGETSKTITVPVNGDRLPEPSEMFVVNLTGPTNAHIADGQGIGTIADDEPRISISDVTKREGRKNTTQFVFTIMLSAPYDQPVTMSLCTVNGTAASNDNDYVARTGTLTFLPGEMTKTITIEVKGDSKSESNEYFYLDLFGNSGNSLLIDGRGVGTILNDD